MTPGQRRQRDTLLASPRVVAESILQGVNPKAAHALVGDDEADALMHAVAVLGKDGTRCPGSAPVEVHDNHQGFYVNQLTVEDFAHIPDPRPALRQDHVPADIAAGQPQAYAARLRAFLRGEPLPLPPCTSARPPS